MFDIWCVRRLRFKAAYVLNPALGGKDHRAAPVTEASCHRQRLQRPQPRADGRKPVPPCGPRRPHRAVHGHEDERSRPADGSHRHIEGGCTNAGVHYTRRDVVASMNAGIDG